MALHRTPTRNTKHRNVLHFAVRVGAGERRALDRQDPREVGKNQRLSAQGSKPGFGFRVRPRSSVGSAQPTGSSVTVPKLAFTVAARSASRAHSTSHCRALTDDHGTTSSRVVARASKAGFAVASRARATGMFPRPCRFLGESSEAGVRASPHGRRQNFSARYIRSSSCNQSQTGGLTSRCSGCGRATPCVATC